VGSWSQRVERVRDHVRTHLADELSVAVLAGVAHASPFHFGRRFRAHTGETPIQFVRRARLERALVLMRTTDHALADVAAEVGLAPASNFSRVFKQTYGIAPSAWDGVTRLTPGLPGFDDALAAFRDQAPSFHARLVDHPAERLAAVSVATPFMDDGLLAAGLATLRGWCARHQVPAEPIVGMSWDNPDATPIEQVRFELGVPVPRHLVVDGGLVVRQLPARRAVAVRVQGSKAFIALAWEYLYDSWLPRSSSEPLDVPAMKRFRRAPDHDGWASFDLDCELALSAQ